VNLGNNLGEVKTKNDNRLRVEDQTPINTSKDVVQKPLPSVGNAVIRESTQNVFLNDLLADIAGGQVLTTAGKKKLGKIIRKLPQKFMQGIANIVTTDLHHEK
jgi:hypothetical protein